MRTIRSNLVGVAAWLALGALAPVAGAMTLPVTFNYLTESATIKTPFLAGDTLLLDTLVTSETGALAQSITFSVGANVASAVGSAVWAISTAAGPGPRLTGVNIDVRDSSNSLVFSDTFTAPTVAGFAHSVLASSILPGTYTLMVTGNGVRESSLDLSLSFVSAVPEPHTLALMLAGTVAMGFVVRRRQR
ncbi:hypothetical protein BH11PSE8_BH11PSE8_28920 [soil metagenome]